MSGTDDAHATASVTIASGLRLDDRQASALPAATAAQVEELLIKRFRLNEQLIKRLLLRTGGKVHCHQQGAPFNPRKEEALGGGACRSLLRVLTIVEEGNHAGEAKAVAAAILLHHPPKTLRHGDHTRFSEAVFLAVEQVHERRNLARTLVRYMEHRCHETGGRHLLIMSSGHQFWRKPEFGFVDIKDSETAREMNIASRLFNPWSDPCELLVKKVDAHARANLDRAIERIRPSSTTARRAREHGEGEGAGQPLPPSTQANKARRIERVPRPPEPLPAEAAASTAVAVVSTQPTMAMVPPGVGAHTQSLVCMFGEEEKGVRALLRALFYRANDPDSADVLAKYESWLIDDKGYDDLVFLSTRSLDELIGYAMDAGLKPGHAQKFARGCTEPDMARRFFEQFVLPFS